jgi:oligosaccharide repeat unit polymerase
VAVLIALPVLVQCFYGLVAVMNRSNSNGIDNPLQYFAFYLGSGIPGLSIWLQSWSSNGIGKFEQLANSLQVLLDNLGVIDGHGGSAAEQWLYIDGPANVGNNVNLTTIFGPSYHDFGIVGVVLVAVMQSIVLSYIFEKAETRYNELAFVCYISLCYLPIEAMRDDFFSYWLGTMGISTLLLIIIQYYILVYNVTAVSSETCE